MILDDDNVNYYQDDDDYFYEKRKQIPKTTIIANDGKKLTKEEAALNQKLSHKTDTRNYEANQLELVTPEEATKAAEEQKAKEAAALTKDYANPVFAQAVKQVEAKLGRKINYDEFDKLCMTYAGELAAADARSRKQDLNPRDYEVYYNQLIKNKKVVPAYKIYANKLEADKAEEIANLLASAKASTDTATLKLKAGASVNIHHKGKVTFEDYEHRRRITIDNKRDVELLHMRRRKDFLDKKYAKEIEEEIGELTHGVHDSDGFE